jgi:hypothetical protein
MGRFRKYGTENSEEPLGDEEPVGDKAQEVNWKIHWKRPSSRAAATSRRYD